MTTSDHRDAQAQVDARHQHSTPETCSQAQPLDQRDAHKVEVWLPAGLLRECEHSAAAHGERLSQFVANAVQFYLRHGRIIDLRERLKQGYLQMGALNLELAEEALGDVAIDAYESGLVGAE